MRRALILGLREQALLRDLTARAAASPTDLATMKALVAATARGEDVGRLNRATTVEIPDGFTVTLTHEEHKPGVLCRHVSIGVRAQAGKGPSPEAVGMILAALGFVQPLGRAPVWQEWLADGTFAVNVLEPLSGDISELQTRGGDDAK